MATKKTATSKPAPKKTTRTTPATKSGAQCFRARLEKDTRALGWTVARIPFSLQALGTMIRLRVKGQINGVPFRTSLFPDSSSPNQSTHYFLVNRAMQEASGVLLGDEADFSLSADLDPREAELPDELAILLDDEPGLHEWYNTLSEYMRREIGKWITAPKSGEARLRRAQQTAERLLATMEGERELPPILAAAFRARPKARLGWQKLSPSHRRVHLMAVFHYQSPEAREKRVQKLCDDGEKRA
ncbi:MAG TPA: YdeI/OmpD-associated family protein [Acidobacteriaceae bacterium]|nr:YdeI/OmpD-associated family protein [Acidobacteriaceae bacterium]